MASKDYVKPACGSTTSAGTLPMMAISVIDISVTFTLSYETICL
jgi:hypothetical protein